MSAKTRRLLALYEDNLHLRFAERTAPEYLAHVRALLAWLFERGIDLLELRAADLLAWQSDLVTLRKSDGRPYSVGFQGNCLSAAKSFFGFLYKRGYLLQDPSATLEYPRREKRLPRVILTPDEVLRMLGAADQATPAGLRDRAILETFYATGIRVSELSNLTPDDVDTEERVLRVVMGKGRKDRNLPLTRAAAEAIEQYLVAGRAKLAEGSKLRYLFVGDFGGWMHRAVLSRLVQSYAKRAGVRKHVTPHTFRHSVATHLLRGRADIRHIQALLGHGSLATTQRYTRVEISDLQEVLRRAHPRGR